MHDIDWKLAPQDARWWAIDADGQAHWFLPPKVLNEASFWHATTVTAPTFGYAGDWRESLRQRPQVSLMLRSLK